MNIIYLDNKFQRFRYYFWENGIEDEKGCASNTMVIFAATVSVVTQALSITNVTQCITQHVTRSLFRYDDKEFYAQRQTLLATVW